MTNVRQYLRDCRELSQLCSQNGWIDNDTLTVEILERQSDQLLAAVQFDEVIMEGSGCVAGRVPCFGRVHVRLDPAGNVLGLDVRD